MNSGEMERWARENGFEVATFLSGERSSRGEFIVIAVLGGLEMSLVRCHSDPEKWLRGLEAAYESGKKRGFSSFEEHLKSVRGAQVVVVKTEQEAPGLGLFRGYSI